MLIYALGDIKEAINNLLIELEGDAHQIWYKPTQQKNSKAKKIFPGVPTGLCPKGIMHSIQHGLKKCEKTLCNAKKLQSRQIWIVFIFLSRLWTSILNRSLLLKWLRTWKGGSILSKNSTNLRRTAARYFSLNMTPLITVWWLHCGIYLSIWARWNASLWIRVKVQGIPPPGEQDPNSITKTRWYCKHHNNYSSKVCYIQHKLVVNLDHPIMLAITDNSCPPQGISTLHHKYFDLKSSKDGHIIYGVFVRMDSATRGWLVDTTYMCSNKVANYILTKTAHCPSAWWYWHWAEKWYTQSGYYIKPSQQFWVRCGR